MENIYKLGDSRYVAIQDSFDGVKASFFKTYGDAVENDLDSRFYQTEANAIRQAVHRFGHEAELVGESEDYRARAFIKARISDGLVGMWRVTKKVVHNRSLYAGQKDDETIKVTEYRSEEEAWDAYEAISFRGLDCYEATKTLYTTIKYDDYDVQEVIVADETYHGRWFRS